MPSILKIYVIMGVDQFESIIFGFDGPMFFSPFEPKNEKFIYFENKRTKKGDSIDGIGDGARGLIERRQDGADHHPSHVRVRAAELHGRGPLEPAEPAPVAATER